MISHVNVNVSYKSVASTWFSELHLCLLFLKNNHPRGWPRGIVVKSAHSTTTTRGSPVRIDQWLARALLCHLVPWLSWAQCPLLPSMKASTANLQADTCHHLNVPPPTESCVSLPLLASEVMKSTTRFPPWPRDKEVPQAPPYVPCGFIYTSSSLS